MADPISLASGLLTLTGFAFKSSVALYETVRSFQSHSIRVRDLLQELEALTGVLGPLTEFVEATTDCDLSPLDLPLLRCGNSCKEFEQELLKCLARSGGKRTSFRDWARLRHLGEDIDGFRRLLAGYKLTINIALTDANLPVSRRTSATSESLDGYKDLIETTRDSLEARLESIDEKLELFIERTVAESGSDDVELQRIKQERLSAEKCLQICAHLSNIIDEIQVAPTRDDGSPEPTGTCSVPEKAMNDCLQDCKNSIRLTTARLEGHMRDLMDRLLAKSRTGMTSGEDTADLERLRDEWETTRQMMEIWSKAESHLNENIGKFENHATGDAVQFMVSTNGKTMHGMNRGLGWRTRQVGGYISDDAVIQISRDMASFNLQNTGTKDQGPSSQRITPITPTNDGIEGDRGSTYSKMYGQGFKLSSMPSADPILTPSLAESEISNATRKR
ncbi:hypothetical protein MaudCBS49596_001143 [Microsporum audouinii]